MVTGIGRGWPAQRGDRGPGLSPKRSALGRIEVEEID
jgi:hypothetical protein